MTASYFDVSAGRGAQALRALGRTRGHAGEHVIGERGRRGVLERSAVGDELALVDEALN